MRAVPNGRLLWMLALICAATLGGCRRTYVIVPTPDRSYTERDTLYGVARGNRVVVSFRFDSVLRVDTVTRLDTLWRGGTRTIVRVDTVRVPAPAPAANPTPTPTGTRVPPRPGTAVPVPSPGPVYAPGGTRVDTVIVTRRDTVIVTRRDTIRVGARDTIRVVVRDTLRITVRDTLRITVRDTLRITVRDTVIRRDTVRVAGRRTLFVPPGQYPPTGQCRVWIHDLPPGRQAAPAPCATLSNIPAGAFILFGGDAWDADYDWVAESARGGVPPEIIALSRRRRP